MRIVVMGPSGVGKSVVGAAMAARAGVPFVDADDLHAPTSIARMAAGTPLQDWDRMPWLDAVAAVLRDAEAGVVVACSALARRHRDRIRAGAPSVLVVELIAPEAELARRMRERAHFMPPALLGSQLAVLEHLGADEPGARVESAGAVAEVARRALAALRGQSLR